MDKRHIYAAAEGVFKRDGWICQYCGLDGKESFASWRSLTWDHLLPSSDPRRDNEEFIVTACGACNMKLCQYWRVAAAQGISLTDKSRVELLAHRGQYVQPLLSSDREYWSQHVANEDP